MDASGDEREDGIVGDIKTTRHDAVDGWSAVGRELQGISLSGKEDGGESNKEAKLRSEERDRDERESSQEDVGGLTMVVSMIDSLPIGEDARGE